jgi:NifU-like protein involved in Fe-S cluster formation
MLTFQRNFSKVLCRRVLAARYHEKVVKYFENPPNVGSLKKAKKSVGTGNNILT